MSGWCGRMLSRAALPALSLTCRVVRPAGVHRWRRVAAGRRPKPCVARCVPMNIACSVVTRCMASRGSGRRLPPYRRAEWDTSPYHALYRADARAASHDWASATRVNDRGTTNRQSVKRPQRKPEPAPSPDIEDLPELACPWPIVIVVQNR